MMHECFWGREVLIWVVVPPVLFFSGHGPFLFLPLSTLPELQVSSYGLFKLYK